MAKYVDSNKKIEPHQGVVKADLKHVSLSHLNAPEVLKRLGSGVQENYEMVIV